MARSHALLRLYNSLLARRAALRSAVAGELENMSRLRADQTGDSADGAFHSDRAEIATQLAKLAARELKQIERALERLKQGTYGICEVCQGRILLSRLNALPYSTTCINCQREMEVYPGGASRRGDEDWEKVWDTEHAPEARRDISVANLETELSEDR